MPRISFQEVTRRLGTPSLGESYGAAWGDFNGDGWTDLWSPNHHDPGNLFLNQRDGRFRESAGNALLTPKNIDPHGSAWADFDNDGDQDLSQSIGGAFGQEAAKTNPIFFNQLFVNQNQKLKDQAPLLGVSDPGGRGRSPLWLDFDNDGLLDLILTNGVKDLEDVSTADQPSTKIYRQTNSGFIDVTDAAGLNFDHARYGTLADLNHDGNLDLVFSSIGRVFDIREFPFRDITSTLFPDGQIPRHRDVAAADFNGDLKTDLFLAKEDLRSDYVQNSPREASVLFRVKEGEEAGFSVKTFAPGKINIQLRSPHYNFALQPDEIFIGASGLQPEQFQQVESFIEFTVDAANLNHHGIQNHVAGDQNGIYVGFDPQRNVWEIYWSNGVNDTPVIQPIALLSSTTILSNPKPIDFQATRDLRSNKNLLLINQGQDQPFLRQSVGGAVPGSASSVVAADFDNDMDVDVYVVNTGAIANLPNTYFENRGNGSFQVRENLGDSAGSTLGVGESVVASDYDRDGFMDLYVTNGRNILGPWFHTDSSPNQLLRNKGNDNHWLHIDLIGTVSNRDGIGSRVLLTAGGVTQLREQNNGAHIFAQNDKRIHFGLAKNTIVGKLEIHWQSGMIQQLKKVAADQILTVIEGRGTTGKDVIQGSRQRDRIFGNGQQDRLSGGLQDDEIWGGRGNDQLLGEGGDDTLDGQQGSDLLVGGRGADRFIFANAGGVDTIQDFSVIEDEIQVSKMIISKSLSKGILSTDSFRLGSSAQLSSDRFLYDRATGSLRFDQDGRGGSTPTLLAILENRPALRASNIRII